MSINLVQWEGSTVTPKLDAIMYDDGSYGIIKGCAITHQGTNLLKIANGFIKIAGRLIEIAEETIQCQVSASGTVNGQLWLRLDLSSVTPAVFMTEAAAVLTPLTQNADCNFQNGIYELQLATYNIDESVITNLVETAPELERLRTALENIDLAANKVTYDNTHSGLSANKVQGAIDEINDNLAGFKFYPTGTELVAYIEGHGWYNADGKYVVWGTATANALVEASPNTYYGRPSEEDLRGEVGADTACPFNKLSDINPSKLEEGPYVISVKKITGSICYASLPCDGYKKVALYFDRTDLDMSYCFVKKDGTETSYTALSYKVWTNYIDILDDYLYIKFKSTTGSGGYALSTFYSLLA